MILHYITCFVKAISKRPQMADNVGKTATTDSIWPLFLRKHAGKPSKLEIFTKHPHFS